MSDPNELVSITVGGGTHTRTAAEWLELARADLRRQQLTNVRVMELAVKHGVFPRWPMPEDNREILGFARELLDASGVPGRVEGKAASE